SELFFFFFFFAKKHNKCVVFDPNFRKKLWDGERARQTMFELIKRSDIVLPGLSKGRFLFGTAKKKTKK
ncbi:2-dehydro-3-deoxygluconokinase, partial [Bacillus obstructivus]